MAPVLLPTWLIWSFKNRFVWNGDPYFDEIVPGIHLGRWPGWYPTSETFPEKCSVIVDTVAEMPIPRLVLFGVADYHLLPCLERTSPSDEDVYRVAKVVAAMPNIVALTASNRDIARARSGALKNGSIYVMSASGLGRAAMFLMVVLVMRRECDTVDEALELIRLARPKANPELNQVETARRVIIRWKELLPGSMKKSRLNESMNRSLNRSLNRSGVSPNKLRTSGTHPSSYHHLGQLPDPHPLSTESYNIIPLSSRRNRAHPQFAMHGEDEAENFVIRDAQYEEKSEDAAPSPIKAVRRDAENPPSPPTEDPPSPPSRDAENPPSSPRADGTFMTTPQALPQGAIPPSTPKTPKTSF